MDEIEKKFEEDVQKEQLPAQGQKPDDKEIDQMEKKLEELEEKMEQTMNDAEQKFDDDVEKAIKQVTEKTDEKKEEPVQLPKLINDRQFIGRRFQESALFIAGKRVLSSNSNFRPPTSRKQ